MTRFNITLSIILGLTLNSFATSYTYVIDISAGYSQEAIIAGIQTACGGVCNESDEIIISIEHANLTFSSTENIWDLSKFKNITINIARDASLTIPENAQLILSEGSSINDNHTQKDGIIAKSTSIPFLKIGKISYNDSYAQRTN